MFSLKGYLSEKKAYIESELDKRLPAENTYPSILHESIRYCVLSGGKRLRPILTMAAASAVNGDETTVLEPALAVELVHTYSLVHDDLPAMDDDELRRDQPTCHVKYGEANAILTGDALLTMAFEWIAKTGSLSPRTLNRICVELAAAAGSRGMVAGQVDDIIFASQDFPGEEILKMVHMNKTASLFKAAMRIGAIGANAKDEYISKLTLFAEKFGLAFQIADDLDDRHEDKTLSAVSAYGVRGSRVRARKFMNSAVEDLKYLPGNTGPLESIGKFVIKSL